MTLPELLAKVDRDEKEVRANYSSLHADGICTRMFKLAAIVRMLIVQRDGILINIQGHSAHKYIKRFNQELEKILNDA